MSKKVPYRIYLSEEQMPKQWYNVRADMKEQHAPHINPATMKPAVLEDMYPVFCEELAKQELDETTRYVDIPEEIQEFYKVYRPSPLIRAYNLEKYLDTPAKIYYKFEGNNTSGSHKLNSAIAQAYYAKKQGILFDHRNRSRSVGNSAFRSMCLLWHSVKSFYGKSKFSAKALQEGDYGNLWR